MSRFNQRGARSGFKGRKAESEHPSDSVHPSILKAARKSGALNLSQRGLTAVPDNVWNLLEDVPEEAKSVSLDNSEDKWWETTELTKLILASNRLTTLGEGLAKFQGLTVLDVHDNSISSLPKALGRLENLQRLDLSHNQLSEIPETVGLLSELLSLQVEHNHLSTVCEEVCSLKRLEVLNLSHNQIESLPRYISLLSQLRSLNVSNNKLLTLPPDIGDLTCLQMFDATQNRLTKLPDEFGNLSKLEQLYLQHNQLAYLPVLRHCSNLKEILVGNNNIRGITKEHLEPISSLTCLDIRDNKLEKVPDEITMLDRLERLILSNNDISTLPNALGVMPNLKAIMLDGNPMRSIRRDVIMRGTQGLKKYLASRMTDDELEKEEPKAASSNVGVPGVRQESAVRAHDLQQLKSLDYSEKKVDHIPDDIVENALQAGVKTINLNKNSFTDIPNNIIILAPTLKEIYLGFNQISIVGPNISHFKNIHLLDLRNNQLSDLPSELSAASCLREIVLNSNRLKAVPQVVFSLEKLEILFAASNQIKAIDADGFNKLKLLGTLDLQNNDIAQVPPELGNCTWIKSLLLTGNPLRNPRTAILAKGTIAILDYLRSRIVS